MVRGVNLLYQLTPSGEVRWQSRLPDGLESNTQLHVAPDGTLYCLVAPVDFGRPAGEQGWMPVATPAGRPLSVSEQLRRTLWGYQPVAGGLRLVAEMHTRRVDGPSQEGRPALIDRGGRLVRARRVRSRTEIFFPAGFTTPELVGGDPVVVLDATAQVRDDFKWERVVLRLGSHGTRTRFSLGHAVYGETRYPDLRVGPDGKLYQLATSPTTGVVISRYSLGRVRQP